MRSNWDLYWLCVRAAIKSSWWLTGAFSTIATPVAAFVANYFKFVDAKTMNTILWLSPLLGLMLCFILIPLRESFSMYRDLQSQLANSESQNVSLRLERDNKARLDAELKESKSQIDEARKAAAVLVASGLDMIKTAVSSDAELTQWESDFHKWQENAGSWVATHFGFPEAEAFVNSQVKLSTFRGHHDDRHNLQLCKLSALVKNLDMIRQRL